MDCVCFVHPTGKGEVQKEKERRRKREKEEEEGKKTKKHEKKRKNAAEGLLLDKATRRGRRASEPEPEF